MIRGFKNSFQKDMKKFKQHVFNLKNQNSEFRSCTERSRGIEAGILVHFSEKNYSNLIKEIHHFVASHNQVTPAYSSSLCSQKNHSICNSIRIT